MKPLKPASLVLIALLSSGILSARAAQSTAFTYQGRLRDNNIPASGALDLRFGLYDAGGNQVGNFFYTNVTVANGLFCVILDFGSVFTGDDRWLETALRPVGQTVYTPLTPRRQLTATPYAFTAGTAMSVPAGNITGTLSDDRLSLNVSLLNRNQTFTGLNTFSGVVQANNTANQFGGAFAGNGSQLTALNGSAIATGTVADGRLSPNVSLLNRDQTFTGLNTFSGAVQANNTANQFAGNGTHLTALNGSEITSGTVADGRLSGNVSFLNRNQTFTGANTFSGVVQANNPANQFTGAFAGDGSHLTALDGSEITSGTVADGRLSGNVSLLNRDQTFTALNTFSGIVHANNPANQFAGAFAGDGSHLTGLNADQITSGTVADGRLSANVAFLNRDQTFTGRNTLTGVAELTNPDNVLVGSHAGDGSGLTNISVANIVGGGAMLLPSGLTVVSTLANDAALVGNGFRLMMTVPAPPWVTSSASSAPSARFGHTAIWDGQRLIIWGGRLMTGSSYLNSGALYYADSDQWQTLSTIGAPSPRWGHTAVWSGTEMLVWGGNGPSAALNTGGRFVPTNQLWKPISTTGSPAGRTEHVAIWTGDAMLIWGGQNPLGLLSDGALYNPVSDQWSTLPSANAPAPRIGATAVWAGDCVLIWGGEGSGGALNSGAQMIKPSSTAQWSSMTISATTPAPRRGHSAIWTGTKMIVWGGQRGGVPLGDGAAYNPLDGSWQALPPSGAPSARFNHAAVWTGEEMLILGGSNGTIEFASGAAYNPTTGVWRPLSSSGTPFPRTEGTAAWTGAEVLIFGGRAQGLPMGSLQRLVPQPVWYFYRKV